MKNTCEDPTNLTTCRNDMQYKKLSEATFLIKLQRGNNVIMSLTDFCKKENIEGGFFYGIGAVDTVELAHYTVETKKYSSLSFNEPLEMTNVTGTIGIYEGKPLIHAHTVFSNPAMEVKAGHLVEAHISGTAEIFLTKTQRLEKQYDPETGLKLFVL